MTRQDANGRPHDASGRFVKGELKSDHLADSHFGQQNASRLFAKGEKFDPPEHLTSLMMDIAEGYVRLSLSNRRLWLIVAILSAGFVLLTFAWLWQVTR